MKVLFLDIDGVILPWDANRGDGSALPAAAINLINAACARTGALVVVSSTQRWDTKTRQRLIDAGLTAEFHTEWRTPLSFHARGIEIAAWLADHAHEVDNYVIVDDNNDMLKQQRQHFAQIDRDVGIQSEDVERIVAILGEKNGKEAQFGSTVAAGAAVSVAAE